MRPLPVFDDVETALPQFGKDNLEAPLRRFVEVRGVVDHQIDRLAIEIGLDNALHRFAVVLRGVEMELDPVA
jgi:hypothetical protein